MELVKLLKTVELFDELTDEQLQRLAEISEPVDFDKGATIFAQGDQGDRLYIVASGEVEVRVGDNPKSARSQVFLGRGQIFGEMALIDRGPRSATTICSRNGTRLYGIAREAFANLCKADTAIGYAVMRNMALELSFKLRHHNLTLA
jgi:CRP/FNR family transcriptional regulator